MAWVLTDFLLIQARIRGHVWHVLQKKKFSLAIKVRTFPYKTFRMEINFILSGWPRKVKKKKRWSNGCAQARWKKIWYAKLIPYFLQRYKTYEVKFPTNFSSLTDSIQGFLLGAQRACIYQYQSMGSNGRVWVWLKRCSSPQRCFMLMRFAQRPTPMAQHKALRKCATQWQGSRAYHH